MIGREVLVVENWDIGCHICQIEAPHRIYGELVDSAVVIQFSFLYFGEELVQLVIGDLGDPIFEDGVAWHLVEPVVVEEASLLVDCMEPIDPLLDFLGVSLD